MMQKKFSRLYQEACLPENQINVDPHKSRLVIFSDHHKGDGSGADDFKKNAALYKTALNYYAEQKFKLIVLGDSEELWENSMGQVIEHYENLIRDEIALALEGPNGKKIRIWGNHDKEVSLRWFRWNSKKSEQPRVGESRLPGVSLSRTGHLPDPWTPRPVL